MKATLRSELPSALLIASAWAITAAAWSRAPERVPVHWGLDGQVDRYGGRAEGLLLVPALAAGMYVLFRVLPSLDPKRASYDLFEGAWNTLRTAILAFLVFMHGVLVANALGWPVDMGRVAPVGVGLLFVVIGNVMGKLRPNWFAGVRTPWTLSSKLSWTRTHRLFGWAFVGTGALTIAAGLLSPIAGFVTLLAGSMAASLGSIVYSWWVWKNDPDKTPPGAEVR